MRTLRRDILKFAGGAAAGAVFTPLPWRLLGDSAIWTQNWSWMPLIPRGETSVREVRCSLCHAGCALKVQCLEEQPYALLPAAHEVCPAGLVGHHLALHPQRLRQTMHRNAVSSHQAALDAARAAAEKGKVAVLDLLPGRAASAVHQAAMKRMNGLYLTPPVIEGATARAISALLPQPVAVTAELSEARFVLSVSTPLLEGWASPRFAACPAFELWQADARRSYTAERAARWLPLQPGGEAALLASLLKVLAGEDSKRNAPDSASLRETLSGVSLEQLVARSGVPAAAVHELAGKLRQQPALVLADGDPVGGPLGRPAQALAAAVNAFLGLDAWRAAGPAPEGVPVERAPAGEIQLLIVDAPLPGVALPWALAADRLAQNAVVVALTWNSEQFAPFAEWRVPVPVFLEGKHEIPPAFDTAGRPPGHSEGWLKPPEDAMAASEFVARLAGMDASGAEVPSRPAPAALSRAVRLWPEDYRLSAAVQAALAPRDPKTVLAFGWRLAGVSPLGKLWTEWDLRRGPGQSAPAAPGAPTVELSGGPGYVQQCRPTPEGAWAAPQSLKEVRS